MSNYSKITDFTTKDSTNALIEGVDFDNEFTAVATASATKADKAVPATANSIAGLDSAGNLYDTTIESADLIEALAKQVDTGMVLPYVGSSAPTGWLDCDGASYATATYSDLFALMGYDFGGSGANFNVPDMRGRTAVGNDNIGGVSADVVTDAQADSMGGEAGTEEFTLTTNELPASGVGFTTGSDGAHTHGLRVLIRAIDGSGADGDGSVKSSEGYDAGYIQSAGAHTHTGTTDNLGSGAALSLLQPSLFMNYIIKT